MTEQVRRMNYAECLIVAPGDGPERIRAQLHRHLGGVPAMMDCCNIYEATAEIMASQGLGRQLLVYVLVDSMPEAEMQFFSCWSKNARVRTVALSMADRQGKLASALAHGADEAMILKGRKSAKALTLRPAVAETPRQVAALEEAQPADLIEDETVDQKKTENMANTAIEEDEPETAVGEEAQQAEPVIPAVTPRTQVTEPLLTEDELKALLS